MCIKTCKVLKKQVVKKKHSKVLLREEDNKLDLIASKRHLLGLPLSCR